MSQSASGYAVAAIAGFVALGCCCHPAGQSSLDVNLHPQETSMWCGLAAGQMVMEYFGRHVPQCQQANDMYDRTDCPCHECSGSPISNPILECLQGGYPDFRRYGFDFSQTHEEALDWDDLRSELSGGHNCRKAPVVFTHNLLGDSAHIMVATGYTTAGGANFVEVADPFGSLPCEGDWRFIPYERYVEWPGRYSHGDDFYAIEPEGD